MWTTKSRV
jgi:ribosomal protein L14E/L6E/L27E